MCEQQQKTKLDLKIENEPGWKPLSVFCFPVSLTLLLIIYPGTRTFTTNPNETKRTETKRNESSAAYAKEKSQSRKTKNHKKKRDLLFNYRRRK